MGAGCPQAPYFRTNRQGRLASKILLRSIIKHSARTNYRNIPTLAPSSSVSHFANAKHSPNGVKGASLPCRVRDSVPRNRQMGADCPQTPCFRANRQGRLASKILLGKIIKHGARTNYRNIPTLALSEAKLFANASRAAMTFAQKSFCPLFTKSGGSARVKPSHHLRPA